MQTNTGDLPWWAWLFLAVLVLGIVVRVSWVWRHGGFRQAVVPPPRVSDGPAYPEVWARTMADRSPSITRPVDVPQPESVDEVARWAGSEDMRSTELIHAPVFWVLLPLAAIGFLVWGAVTDPGDGWTGNLFDDEFQGQPWNAWIVWAGVGVWLLIAIGVLLLRLSVLKDLRAQNEWIFEHGVAYSIHRASVDYDDGEASGWPTYVALDHRLDHRQAARIREAFEQWLSLAGLPPSGSEPISSTTLFGAHAEGGYFFLHLPVSQTAGVTTAHRWMLVTRPQGGEGDMTVTPVPVDKRLRKIREKLRRRAGS